MWFQTDIFMSGWHFWANPPQLLVLFDVFVPPSALEQTCLLIVAPRANVTFTSTWRRHKCGGTIIGMVAFFIFFPPPSSKWSGTVRFWQISLITLFTLTSILLKTPRQTLTLWSMTQTSLGTKRQCTVLLPPSDSVWRLWYIQPRTMSCCLGDCYSLRGIAEYLDIVFNAFPRSICINQDCKKLALWRSLHMGHWHPNCRINTTRHAG